jgi:hypothetical protein
MLQRRRMQRIGGRLGLFALWLQLALSFGHIHASDLYRFGHPLAHDPGAVELIASHGPMPPEPGRSGLLHQDCAICANMALASALLPAEPPTLPRPSLSGRVAIAGERALALAAPRHLLFQTRAPPSA